VGGVWWAVLVNTLLLERRYRIDYEEIPENLQTFMKYRIVI
jgi:hypothetical protein